MRPSVQQPISKDKNVMVQTRKYYLKNHYLTLKSKVNVTGRSLWYVTHHLMGMHPHTKYHWPISKETIIWPWGQRSRSHKGHYGTRHTVSLSCTHIPNIIDLSRKTKNVMARTRKYYLKNNYLTFMSKVKVQWMSLWYATHRLIVMHPHTKYHWPISKDKICYGQDKKILFKKQLFDLHVKGQGPTKVITVCDTPPYGHAPTYQIPLTYLERNNYLTFRWKDKVSRRSLQYVTHCLMVIHPHTKYHWPISRQKCYGPDNKILFKKQLFDLEVKGQGSREVNKIHDTPPYGHAPIPNIIDLSQKKQLFDPKVKGQGPIKVIMVCDTPPYGHAPTYQLSLTYLERQKCYGPDKKILFKLEAQPTEPVSLTWQ
jgi:hypothetical protein